MDGAHHNLNGSCDLTTIFLWCFVILELGLSTISLPTKFEVCISADYDDMKRDSKWGGLG